MTEYHYIQSEPGLWTVGTGTPGKGGDWEPESDHDSPEKAAQRVRWLNGGDTLSPTTHEVLKGKDEEIARLRELLKKVTENTRECSHCDGTGSMLGARPKEACGVCGGYGFNPSGDIRQVIVDIRAELVGMVKS